jgi:hypothetical protein
MLGSDGPTYPLYLAYVRALTAMQPVVAIFECSSRIPDDVLDRTLGVFFARHPVGILSPRSAANNAHLVPRMLDSFIYIYIDANVYVFYHRGLFTNLKCCRNKAYI